MWWVCAPFASPGFYIHGHMHATDVMIFCLKAFETTSMCLYTHAHIFCVLGDAHKMSPEAVLGDVNFLKTAILDI